MPAFTPRESYVRKSRRIAKYGKFRKPAGAVVRYAYGKGRGRGAKKIMVPKFLNPFQKDHELVQLKYTQSISLDPTVNTGTSGNVYAFSFNSLFDPDVSGTGNQPMYFDNYSQLYSRYKVSFAKMKVTVVNHSVNTAVWNGSAVVSQPNQSYKLAILRDISATDYPSNMDALIQQNAANVKWRYVAPQLNGRLPQLTMNCAPHKTCGVAYDDDTLQGTNSSNPSRNVIGNVVIWSADGITDPPTVRLCIEITYYAKFFDRLINQAPN